MEGSGEMKIQMIVKKRIRQYYSRKTCTFISYAEIFYYDHQLLTGACRNLLNPLLFSCKSLLLFTKPDSIQSPQVPILI